jgi:hypothetical protein
LDWRSVGVLYRTIGKRQPHDKRRLLRDIKEKLNRWGSLSHHPEIECDMAWLLEQPGEQEAQIARLEARLETIDWILLLA